jgi:hypothetical protein
VLTLHRDRDSRASRRVGTLTVSLLAGIALTSGCSQYGGSERGYGNQSWTQIRFYSPPGATVEVRTSPPQSRQIPPVNAYENALEHSPDESAIFNLAPGTYEFKYTSAEGLPGVSAYGELIIEHANSAEAKVFQRRSFIPISVPSEYYQRVEITGDMIFPYVGSQYRYTIDAYDIERLKTGDVIEKVIFVADLEKAECRNDELEREIAVTERELEWADARFHDAYLDFQIDVSDPWANFWGTDRRFIKWEERRREMQQELEQLEEMRDRNRALLRGDQVLTRKGMLVLATQEVVEPHRDVPEAAGELGEVLVIMRIGGRHMHWGDPRSELVAYGQ